MDNIVLIICVFMILVIILVCIIRIADKNFEKQGRDCVKF